MSLPTLKIGSGNFANKKKFQSQMVLTKPQLEILLSLVTRSPISIPCFVNR